MKAIDNENVGTHAGHSGHSDARATWASRKCLDLRELSLIWQLGGSLELRVT